MFGKKRKQMNHMMDNLDSIIGDNMIIIGDIKGSGSIRIDGTVEGDIDYTGDITIGETGHIKGNIICNNIIIGGKIDGNINAKEQLSLLPSGELIGDVEVINLVVNENAIFEGHCKMKQVSETLMFEQPKLASKEKAE
ncbi:MAG TPA: polymer-forming cytoskeletal protein [Tissierellales bacterium]|nr:polymer-forming cytoskeletal protein [Tissierellales bacterium]